MPYVLTLHCVVSHHDKVVSATIFSKLLTTFVESRVMSFVQLHATPTVCCDLTLLCFACSCSPHNAQFLGMRIQVPHDATATKQTLTANLKRMLQAVDKCPLTSHQKLRLYKFGVCPRLSWLLLIEELPITWVERELEATATRFLKKWAGLAKCANTALL